MRIVIDSNVLTEQSLRDFLTRSRKNKALVTDYLMVEALKGDPPTRILGLMKILCEFPKQVVVLKSLQSLSALKGRRCGMTRRMVEKSQTKNFSIWCVGLGKAEAGEEPYKDELAEKGKEASAQMERLTAAQSNYAEVIADEAKHYTEEELRTLRTDQPYTPAMVEKIAERVVSLTTKFIESRPGANTPSVSELPYTYYFRLGVCAYVQTLGRIRDGGAQKVTAEKIANDIIDATFVVQATYFQGLLSGDAKANALYRNVKHILKGFPVSPKKLKEGGGYTA